MAITRKLTTQDIWSGAGITTVTKSVEDEQSGGNETIFDESIPNGADQQLIGFSCDISQLKLLLITATDELTLETNSSSTPQETITVDEVNPVRYRAGGSESNPFSGDVTALYVTNGNAGAVTLTIRMLTDPTA